MKKHSIAAITLAVSSQVAMPAFANVDEKIDSLQQQLDILQSQIDMHNSDVKQDDASKTKIKIGGRLQADFATIDLDDVLDDALYAGEGVESGAEFRRARIYLKGTLYDNVEFKMEYDFKGGDPEFKDAYIGLKKLPGIGNLKFGKFKDPFSLENKTSSNSITFMERAMAVSVFSPGRNTGVLMHDNFAGGNASWAASITKESADKKGTTGASGIATTMRLTGLPIYADNGKQLLHLGLAYSNRDLDDVSARFKDEPEIHLADNHIDTGSISDAETVSLIGLEAAWVNGSFSLQSEYVQASVESELAADPKFSGLYFNASYLLTGETRKYSKKKGAFSGVTPNTNFGAAGSGAWELAARYSTIEADDENVELLTSKHGGEVSNLVLGVNWYLNPNARMMFNYVQSETKESTSGLEGDAQALMARVQIAI